MPTVKANSSYFFQCFFLICLALFAIGCQDNNKSEGTQVTSTVPYFPEAGAQWEKRNPEAFGINKDSLEIVMDFVRSTESVGSKDLGKMLMSRARSVHDSLIGPTKERGKMNGIILKDGYIIYEFGDTKRMDMTFSITKSFLSTMAALALDSGLLTDLHEPVYHRLSIPQFEGDPHNKITWHHLLQQTSEWEGTLWGKPDLADRRKGEDRTLNEPGTFWEYNDVRVNLAALALLHIWQKPLPEVLEEEIMTPIAASDSWQWHGYRNSDIEINNQTMKSVSGGGHWGGGMWISTRDLARFGYLFLMKGQWDDQQLFDASWIDNIRTPCEAEPTYGYMWWLNTDRKMWPDVPADSYAARGGGSNIIWVYPKKKLVVVIRWIQGNKVNDALAKINTAIN
ncbi:serine hydrolase [Fulvivirgaceae bacterium BMA10]|uniref:Serine hydrolase n=1 Tax=Splendidivirga corallicola TaxID=3051826 RepID=A0ABT8KQ75_9BACT|nr:serine hydrolase [Fulvivirgaceae bacterium BMA10]